MKTILKAIFKREEMSVNNTIYYISSQDIKDTNILYNEIYKNSTTNYYFTDDFSKDFYIELARLGFITTSLSENNQLYLLPELQFAYAILDFKDLHISKKVKKLINNKNYTFTKSNSIKEVINEIQIYHQKDNWLIGKYKNLLFDLEKYSHPSIDFQLKSFELRDVTSNKLIAGEIGYKINNIYTSLTGFSSREKEYNNYGKLQLVLLAQYLERNNYKFWNLGHPYMKYKFDLGAKEYSRLDFLKRWLY